MSAAARLEAALLAATDALLEVVGLPANPVDCCGERIPVTGSLVCRDEVPDVAFRAACVALQYLMIGHDVMDPEAPSVVSVEDGLAAMMKGRGDEH